MKTRTLLALICLSLLAPSLLGQANALIPEEARKHFVMGETMFKEAKSAANFSQAAGEFAEAARLAPQWPEARYNLALAKEAAGDYSGAMSDLKLYQQFKLSDSEGRKVQDKIYALEAKQQIKESDNTAKAATEAAAGEAKEIAARSRFIKTIQGDWGFRSSGTYFSIRPLENGNVTITFVGSRRGVVSDISITGSTLRFKQLYQYHENPELLEHWSLSVDSYGRLKGTETDYYTQRGKETARKFGQPDWNDNHGTVRDWVFDRISN